MINLIIGPMRSGKSEYLLKKINECIDKDQKVFAFTPSIDSRNGQFIKSRNGVSFPSEPYFYNQIKKLRSFINTKYFSDNKFIVFIDEVFMLDDSVFDFINSLSRSGYEIYVSGLLFDSEQNFFKFSGKRNKTMQDLVMIADNIITLYSDCDFCGKHNAGNTYCKIKKEHDIMIGDEIYGTYCDMCEELKNDFIKKI